MLQREKKKITKKEMKPAQIKRVREVFTQHYDRATTTISIQSLRTALRTLALCPSEEDFLSLIQVHDPGSLGSFSFDAFLALVRDQYNVETQRQNVMLADATTLDAFVALGGNRNRTGVVSAERLKSVIQHELMLPIRIDKLIKEVDKDGSGYIDYEEFRAMMGD